MIEMVVVGGEVVVGEVGVVGSMVANGGDL